VWTWSPMHGLPRVWHVHWLPWMRRMHWLPNMYIHWLPWMRCMHPWHRPVQGLTHGRPMRHQLTWPWPMHRVSGWRKQH